MAYNETYVDLCHENLIVYGEYRGIWDILGVHLTGI